MRISPIRFNICRQAPDLALQFEDNTQNTANNFNSKTNFFTQVWNSYLLFVNKILISFINSLQKLITEVWDKSCHAQIVFFKNYLIAGNKEHNCPIMATLNALRAYSVKNNKPLKRSFNSIEEVRDYLKNETNYIQFKALKDNGDWENESKNGLMSNVITSLVFQEAVGKYAEHWIINDLENKQKFINLKYLFRAIYDLQNGKVGVMGYYIPSLNQKHLITILDCISPQNNSQQVLNLIKSTIQQFGESVNSSIIDNLPNLGYFLVYDQLQNTYTKLSINDYLKNFEESEIIIPDSLFSDQKDSKEFSKFILKYAKTLQTRPLAKQYSLTPNPSPQAERGVFISSENR